jgi:hypothetical protein
MPIRPTSQDEVGAVSNVHVLLRLAERVKTRAEPDDPPLTWAVSPRA